MKISPSQSRPLVALTVVAALAVVLRPNKQNARTEQGMWIRQVRNA